MAPFHFEFRHLHTEGLANLAPALAELAAVHDQGLVARRQEIGHSPFHAPRPGGSQDQHIIPGLKKPLEVFSDLAEQLGKLRRPMVDDRPGHRQQDFGGNRRGPRSKQIPFQHRPALLRDKWIILEAWEGVTLSLGPPHCQGNELRRRAPFPQNLHGWRTSRMHDFQRPQQGKMKTRLLRNDAVIMCPSADPGDTSFLTRAFWLATLEKNCADACPLNKTKG